ncbi:hypothetical protein KDK_47530 [Dictyobacter kobayashii]|uniref:Glycosyl transferase family 1 n=1 Tax=Dictyobacter kobayashii TaxID=2014872 RepID=A0A402AP58_9CHLR|nr:hypothetical protein KDK_47530 [Dictyobacter kobayashii]
MRSTFLLLRTPADIYHAHDVSGLPACYIAACLRRKPLVFESHEMPLFERPLSELNSSRRFLRTILALLLKRIVPRCAGVITVSPPIVEEIRRRYHVSRIALLRNLPEYREVPRNNRLREHLQLAASTRIVLYQGNIQPNRELDRLIHAASHFEPGIVLVIMGKDMKGTVSQLHSLIEQQGVAGQVKILPPVPYSELLTWTASADLGVTIYSPDYSLNVSMFLPNKLFEYLLVGVPVLSSNIGPIVEVIQKYDVGQIIASLAPEDIAAAINLLLHDKEALQRMRAHALTASRDELCWEKESPRLLQLYAEIAHKEC